MGWRNRPGEPDPPDDPGPAPPAASIPSIYPGADLLPYLVAEQAVTLPTAWGTVKCAGLLIEKLAPLQSDPPGWTATTGYAVGQFVQNGGNAYECINRGTSAGSGGPSGSGANITDGTVAWKFRQQLPFPIYNQLFLAALCEGEIRGALSLWWDKERVAAGTLQILPKNLGILLGPDAANQTVNASFDQAGYQHTALLTANAGGTFTGTAKELPAVAVELQGVMFAQPIAAPVLLTITPSGTGGTLPFGVHYYKVTALNASGESLGSNELSVQVFGSTSSIALTWGAVGGATAYRVYHAYEALGVGVTSGAGNENAFYSPGNVTSFTDTNGATTVGRPPADVNPADLINDLLTHNRRGAGWPGSRVDASITGTGAAGLRVYCDALGLRFSMLLDSQRTALDLLTAILDAVNSDGIWSGGKLKVIPLGDQTIASPVFGSTSYVPANVAQYALTSDDFLDRLQPIQIICASDADTFNTWPVEYIDRAAGYAKVTVEDPDPVDVDRRNGKVISQVVSLPFIFADGTLPVMLSRIFTQRSLNVINTYTFRLPWKYVLLEPTDIVTLTDTVSGIVGVPVRITQWEEGADWTIVVTAQDYPAAVAAAVAYTPQAGDGYRSNEIKTTQALITQTPHATLSSNNYDNIFPNPTSEEGASDGADTTRAEWAGRFNDAGAFAGEWVRQLAALSGARQLLGDVALDSATIVKPAYQSQLGCQIRCSPGESFYMESMVRFVTTSTLGDGAGVGIAFLDGSRQLITASPMWGLALWGISLWGSAGIVSAPGSFPSTWTKATAFAVAPTGTVFAHFYLYANSDQGQVTAQFDAIYGRRQIDAGLLQNEPWSGFTYLNSWGALAGSTIQPGYFKDLLGKVQLRGTIASGTMSASAQNFPAAYRPTADMRFVVDSNGAFGRVTITAAGDLIPDVGTNTAIALDGIVFDTRS